MDSCWTLTNWLGISIWFYWRSLGTQTPVFAVRGREQLRAFRYVILRYRRIGPVFDTGYGNAVNVIRTLDYEQAGCRRRPPSRTRPHPQALRAQAWSRRSTSWRSCAVTSSKGDTGPPCCDAALRVPAATLAHLRARFDLTTHGKTPAARLGSGARKAGSHLRLPRVLVRREVYDDRTISA